MKQAIIFLSVLSMFVVASCQRKALNEERGTGVLELNTLKDEPWRISNLSSQEQANILKSTNFANLIQIISRNKKKDWSAMHQEAKVFLVGIKDDNEKKYFYQFIVNYMFRKTNILSSSNNKEKIAAIDFYTKKLIEAGSGDAELLLAGIGNLKSVWTQEQIRKAIISSQEPIRKHLSNYESYLMTEKKYLDDAGIYQKQSEQREAVSRNTEDRIKEMDNSYKNRQIKAQQVLESWLQ